MKNISLLSIRFGLCCLFVEEGITFKTTTAKILSVLTREKQLEKSSHICLHNAVNLLGAVRAAHRLGIGAFRIMSPIFPRMTHPDVGYDLEQLCDGDAIKELLAATRSFAIENDIRLSFHPDQFVVLSSPHSEVVINSIRELIYHGQLADAVGAEDLNIHAGGVYGDKMLALERFCHVFADLPYSVSSRLTLENDDKSYTVRDLLPVCEKLSIPLVYDIHHHRCNPDGLTIEDGNRLAGETWKARGREPYCHLSSPIGGWGGKNPKPHADYIDPVDFPSCWFGQKMTVDIEAKAKELAVVRLMAILVNGPVDE